MILATFGTLILSVCLLTIFRSLAVEGRKLPPGNVDYFDSRHTTRVVHFWHFGRAADLLASQEYLQDKT